MLVTLLGIVTWVSIVHNSNDSSPMLVTLVGIMKLLPTLPSGYRMSVVWCLSNKTPAALLYAGLLGSTVMLVRLVQELNASAPMLVTLWGIVTVVRPLQPRNARHPMLLTLLGIVMLVRPVQ